MVQKILNYSSKKEALQEWTRYETMMNDIWAIRYETFN